MSSDDGSLERYREQTHQYIVQLSGGNRYEQHIALCLKETFEQAQQTGETPPSGWEVWLQHEAKEVFIKHLPQFLAQDVGHYFTPLYLLYESSVRSSIALTLIPVQSNEAVEDCLQSTFEKVYKTLVERKPEDIVRLEYMKSWLNKIAEHVVFDWKKDHSQTITTLQQGTKTPLMLKLEPIELEIGNGGVRTDVLDPEPLNQPEQKVEQEGTREEVREYVALLSETYRVAIQLHYFEGLKLEQIAERLGSPLGAIKANMSRGRAMLHDYMTVRWAVELDERAKVLKSIETLKDPYRTVLRLHFIERMDLPEVAVRCKRSVDSVRRYLYYGAKIVAAYVEPERKV